MRSDRMLSLGVATAALLLFLILAVVQTWLMTGAWSLVLAACLMIGTGERWLLMPDTGTRMRAEVTVFALSLAGLGLLVSALCYIAIAVRTAPDYVADAAIAVVVGLLAAAVLVRTVHKIRHRLADAAAKGLGGKVPPRLAASAPTSIPTNMFGMAELGSHSMAASGTEEAAESGGGLDGRDGCYGMCCGSRRPNGCGLVLVLLLVLAVCTVTWEAIAAASDLGINQRGTAMLFDNPDVSGDSFLNWRCVGPTENYYNATVLYMHGYTGSSLDGIWIERAVQNEVRYCAYDRAGYGWSDPGPSPRTANTAAAEALAALQKEGVTGNLILLAHSLGLYNSLALAKLLADNPTRGIEFRGAVVVDGLDPRWVERLGPQTTPRPAAECSVSASDACTGGSHAGGAACPFWSVVGVLVPLGSIRAVVTANFGRYVDVVAPLPEDIAAETLSNALKLKYAATSAEEGRQFAVSCGQALLGEAMFGADRVAALEIIACGSNDFYDANGYPGGKGLNSTKLVRLHPRANLTYLPDTSHVGIMFVENEAAHVTAALRRVLDAVAAT